MSPPSTSPRVVVIGAAPMMTNGLFQDPGTPGSVNRFIDGSDVVIRMNNLKNAGVPGLGHRTDIHALTNTGEPGARYAGRSVLDHPILVSASEVWFGSDPELIDSQEAEQVPTEMSGQDWAPRIIEAQRWQRRVCRYIPPRVVRDLRAALKRLDSQSKDPSLGARVIAQVMADCRFKHHSVYLLGFGFRGVDAHDFSAEHRWVDQLVSEGRICRVPGNTAGRWFPHRSAGILMHHLWRVRHDNAYRKLKGRVRAKSAR